MLGLFFPRQDFLLGLHLLGHIAEAARYAAQTVRTSSAQALTLTQISNGFAPPAKLGDTYQIALVPSNSYFQDPNFNNINYSITAANITIAEPIVSAVPEPSSLLLSGIGELSILFYSCGRNRRKASLRHGAM